MQDLLASTLRGTPRLLRSVELRKATAVQFVMKQPPINDPAYWRERAGETRRIAKQLADVVAKQTLLDIALSYEALAKIAEERPTIERST